MELEAKKVKVSDCKTISEFVVIVRERTKNMKVSNTTINYHIEHKDTLDWVIFGNTKLIVMNQKAKDFNPGGYYGHNKTRTRTDQL